MRRYPAKIRSVTQKSTGHKLHVVGKRHTDVMFCQLLDDARYCADLSGKTEIAGSFVMSWDADGNRRSALRLTPDNSVELTVLPEFVKIEVKRQIL